MKLPKQHEAAPAVGSSDPIWRIAFPIYYFLVFGYGTTATITYDLVQTIAPHAVNPISGAMTPAPSQVYGALLMVIFGAVALVTTLLRGRFGRIGGPMRKLGDMLALAGTVLLIVAMGVYAAAIYLDVLNGEIQRLPSVLFPCVIGWFPLVAIIALVRTSRRQDKGGPA